MTRTAKGTASSKASGTTLAVNSVSAVPGDALVVGIVYDTGAGAPTVKWGQRSLRQKSTATQVQSGIAVATFILSHINNTATRNIVATWGGSITAKAMVIVGITGANITDVAAKQGQTATGSPDTTSDTSTVADTISIAFFGSEGPSSDTVGTVGSGHTSGQRVGTAGIPPVSNVTIHETYEILSSTGTIQATKTGATSRDWASVIVALKASRGTQNLAVTASDYIAIEEKFESASKDYSLLATMFNEELGRFEAFESTDMATVICHSGNGWI
jgi:hypothetical protein